MHYVGQANGGIVALSSRDAIRTEGLWKNFGRTVALAGLDIAVPGGTTIALVGPAGAGKTTVTHILTTLSRSDRGRAEVAGFDVATAPEAVRARIGYVGRTTALDAGCSGRRNLVTFARLCHLDRRDGRRRADEQLDRFGLSNAAEQPVREYTAGMRRRLDLAVSTLLDPLVLVVDEPTTDLDPHECLKVWRMLRLLAAEGTTTLLTTCCPAEAELVADQVVTLARGRAVAAHVPGEALNK